MWLIKFKKQENTLHQRYSSGFSVTWCSTSETSPSVSKTIERLSTFPCSTFSSTTTVQFQSRDTNSTSTWSDSRTKTWKCLVRSILTTEEFLRSTSHDTIRSWWWKMISPTRKRKINRSGTTTIENTWKSGPEVTQIESVLNMLDDGYFGYV